MNANDMLINPFSFEDDEDTILFFNGILYFLIEHFGNSKEDSIAMINEYYYWHQNNGAVGADGETWIDRLGHDDIYIAAARIYYRSLSLPSDKFYDWLKRMDSLKAPEATFNIYTVIMNRLRDLNNNES